MARARWTPADGAGSMRFSKRYRDTAGEEYAQWLDDDAPPFTASNVATVVGGVLLLLCALALARRIVHLVRSLRSDWRARELVASEERWAASAAAAAAEARLARAGVEGPTRQRERICRFCDVAVSDEHEVAHLAGKKHRRLAAIAERAASGPSSCWAWREVCAPAAREAAEQGGSPRDSAEPVVELIASGKGKGAWQPVRRRHDRA